MIDTLLLLQGSHTERGFLISFDRKATTSVPGTNYFNFISFNSVISDLSSPTFRSFKISTWNLFHCENELLQKFVHFNLFTRFIIDNFVDSSLCKKLTRPLDALFL